MSYNGDQNYYHFTDNGNDITVDGVTVAYDSMMNHMITHYDGLALSLPASIRRSTIARQVASLLLAVSVPLAVWRSAVRHGSVR